MTNKEKTLQLLLAASLAGGCNSYEIERETLKQVQPEVAITSTELKKVPEKDTIAEGSIILETASIGWLKMQALKAACALAGAPTKLAEEMRGDYVFRFQYKENLTHPEQSVYTLCMDQTGTGLSRTFKMVDYARDGLMNDYRILVKQNFPKDTTDLDEFIITEKGKRKTCLFGKLDQEDKKVAKNLFRKAMEKEMDGCLGKIHKYRDDKRKAIRQQKGHQQTGRR